MMKDSAEALRQARERARNSRNGGNAGPAPDLDLLDAAELATRPMPEREFLDSASLLPMRNVTMLGGAGGVGKSLLALQLAVAVRTATPWIGFDVKQGPAIYFSAEDDINELQIRLSELVAAEGYRLEDLGDLKLAVLAGRDAVLAAEDHKLGRLVETPLLGKLRTAMAAVRPVLLIIDNLADTYAGNENVRPFAKHFVGMLRGLAIDHGCAVLLLNHPSLSGLASGSGMSGSTAWHNSVRSRVYLAATRDKNGDSEEETDPDQRWLTVKKANYAPIGEPIPLRWQDGRFVRSEPDSAFKGVTLAHLEAVRDTFRSGAWRYDERSPEWGGIVVARIIDVDVGAGLAERDMTAEQKAARRKVKTVLSVWMRNKQIRMVERADASRHMRKFYEAA